MVKFYTLSPCLMVLSCSLYMQFLKLLSEHLGVIKPGEYDIDVRLAVSESAHMVVFLWQRIHTALFWYGGSLWWINYFFALRHDGCFWWKNCSLNTLVRKTSGLQDVDVRLAVSENASIIFCSQIWWLFLMKNCSLNTLVRKASG